MHFIAFELHFDLVYLVCMDYVLIYGQYASVICYECLGYVSLEISCCISSGSFDIYAGMTSFLYQIFLLFDSCMHNWFIQV